MYVSMDHEIKQLFYAQGANSESETDHCEQLDKSAKLHALKVQAQLTYQDILLLPTKDQTT